MRINSISQVSQLYQNNSISRTKTTSNAQKTDKVEISSLGIDFQTARAAVVNSPDIRSEKIDNLKGKIQTDNYNVSTEDFAAKLLETYKAKMSL